MNTAVATVEPVAEFQPPRLPYHPAIEQRFGVDRSGWKALVEAIFPAAKSVDSVVMALSYCRARGLDVFKRPVHIVPMWDSRKRAYVDTVWPGIAEVRTTAFRTGQYAGCDEAEFGHDIEQTFTGTVKAGRDETVEKTVTVRFPEWCRMTVYRMVGGQRVAFVGPKVYWLETYARIGNTDLPNDMWAKRTRGQIEKCAEAGALRKAFPEEVGNMLTAEEMEGQHLIVDASPKVEQIEERTVREKAKTRVVQAGQAKEFPPVAGQPLAMPVSTPADTQRADLIEIDADGEPELPKSLDRREKPAETAAGVIAEPGTDGPDPVDPERLYADAEAQFAQQTAMDGVDEVWALVIEPHIESGAIFFPGDKDKLTALYRSHRERVTG